MSLRYFGHSRTGRILRDERSGEDDREKRVRSCDPIFIMINSQSFFLLQYMRTGEGFLLVFAVNSAKSFEDIGEHHEHSHSIMETREI